MVSKNRLEQKLHKVSAAASSPPTEGDRISYGEIEKVLEETFRVVVRVYGEEELLMQGQGVPIMRTLSYIQHNFGELRPGLKVQIHWRGQKKATWAIVDIIGDEELDLEAITKEPLLKEPATPPTAIFAGGKSKSGMG